MSARSAILAALACAGLAACGTPMLPVQAARYAAEDAVTQADSFTFGGRTYAPTVAVMVEHQRGADQWQVCGTSQRALSVDAVPFSVMVTNGVAGLPVIAEATKGACSYAG